MAGTLAKALMGSSLAISTALAATEAMAQHTQSVLPQQSGVYWGQMLGQVLGASVGAVAAKNFDNQGVAQIVMGVSTEVGRNLGAIAAGEAYRTISSPDASGSMPLELRDRMDTLGLQAAFAFENFARLQQDVRMGRASSAQLNQAQFEFAQSRQVLEAQARDLQMRGYNAQPWLQMSFALAQNVVPVARVVELAQAMSARLHRPGGPGYRPAFEQARSFSSLSELRSQVESRQMQRERIDQNEYERPAYN